MKEAFNQINRYQKRRCRPGKVLQGLFKKVDRGFATSSAELAQ